MYLTATPWWLRVAYPMLVWSIPSKSPIIYLTFDDGPHPEATPFVLDTLAQYNAKATFFCIGKNVTAYPAIYKNIIEAGHTIGNHTNHHLNGWKNTDIDYFKDIQAAALIIDSSLFRPPYGKITRFQAKALLGLMQEKQEPVVLGEQPKEQPYLPIFSSIIMWSVLSGDFDINLSKEKCLQNVLCSTKAGSIVVMHDSEKAFPNMQYALPKLLEYFSNKGYSFAAIPNDYA